MPNRAESDGNPLATEYRRLLQKYVEAPGEPLREEAYQLAHKAMARGQGVLDVVALHHEALLAALAPARTAQQIEEITKRAAELVLNGLAAFEITHRGYQETIQRLKSANEELVRSRAELEQRVAERTAELARANEVLRSEAAERQRAQEERERALFEAQRRAAQLDVANQELQAFVYSVSHDLRAPLRHIDGFSQALLEDYADKLDEQGQRYLGIVRTASRRMDEFITALLRLSRVIQAELRPQQISLSDLAMAIFADLSEQDPERQVETIVAPNLMANGDRQLLHILLENLLTNAWKFTAKTPQARIEFGITNQDGQPVYFVRDNGAGFDMDYADKLFMAFQRLHRAEEYPGTGIGLATAQRIVRRHGGKIWAEGKVDQGATFYFTLR